ncbi:hypothetical protein BJ973_001293 [Actinoplanes tereljensis]|nr:hypothetical protein [Actinoplanes tereljensis]
MSIRRAAPAIALFFLSPLVAEFLLGDFTLAQLPFLFLLGPAYGGAAIVIRWPAAARSRRSTRFPGGSASRWSWPCWPRSSSRSPAGRAGPAGTAGIAWPSRRAAS